MDCGLGIDIFYSFITMGINGPAFIVHDYSSLGGSNEFRTVCKYLECTVKKGVVGLD